MSFMYFLWTKLSFSKVIISVYYCRNSISASKASYKMTVLIGF